MFLNLFKSHVKTKLRIYCFYFALKICYWVNSACILTFTANKPNRNYKHYTLSEETFLYKKKKNINRFRTKQYWCKVETIRRKVIPCMHYFGSYVMSIGGASVSL